MFAYFLEPEDEIFETMMQAVEEAYLPKWSKFENWELLPEEVLQNWMFKGYSLQEAVCLIMAELKLRATFPKALFSK